MTTPLRTPWRDGQVIANDMRLHYLDWGNEGAPNVVFLHGGNLSAHTWDRVCRELTTTARCIAVDLRGHGDSEWSPIADYRPPAHADDIDAFCAELGLGRVTLVGHSLGGRVAMTVASRGPLVERLVLVDIGPDSRQSGRQQVRKFNTESMEPATLEEIVERVLAIDQRRSREDLHRSLPRSLRRLPDGRWAWKHDTRRFESLYDPDEWQRQTDLLWECVAKITCPTLVVRGGKSTMLHDEDAAKLAAALAHGTWLKIDGAGHTVQAERPHELAEAIRTFLSA